MITLKESDEYTPGEPYEFLAPAFDNPIHGDLTIPVPRYRCFRGDCKGRQVQTADRNTHNNYHNNKGD